MELEQGTIALIIASIGGFISIVTLLFNFRMNKSKALESEAHASELVTKSALSLLEPYKETVKELTIKYDNMEIDFANMKTQNVRERQMFMEIIAGLLYGVYTLQEQLEEACIEPEYTVPDDIPEEIVKIYKKRYPKK